MRYVGSAVLLVVLTVSYFAHADVTGKPRVIDGDTIEIGKTKIRLHGVDAPEMKQTCRISKGKEQMCGQLAKQALERLVKGQEITCKGDKRDRYKRLIAVCYVGLININEQMMTDGWAMAYRKYSKDYVRAETFTKSRREGLWLGEFEPPWGWPAPIKNNVFLGSAERLVWSG
jgi:endonuclease YncB( thermonuclease family)